MPISDWFSVRQVCLLLLGCRTVIESGNSFIHEAMNLDTDSQLDIRDMLSGLLEPGHTVTDEDLTNLLTRPRGYYNNYYYCRLLLVYYYSTTTNSTTATTSTHYDWSNGTCLSSPLLPCHSFILPFQPQNFNFLNLTLHRQTCGSLRTDVTFLWTVHGFALIVVVFVSVFLVLVLVISFLS